MKFPLRLRAMCVVCMISGFSGANLSAAPKESPQKASADKLTEIPAVPFLTLALVRDSAVQQDLKLNASQMATAQDAIAEVDGAFWRLRDTPVDECAAQLESLQTQLRKRLRDDWTVEQLDRFEQILLQRRSWRALISPDVSQQLTLSKPQVAKLRTALQQSIKEHESLETEIAQQSFADQQKARKSLQVADTRRFTAILTTEQQDTYLKLLGTGFDFSKLTPIGCVAPELHPVGDWINSPPLTLNAQRGKVVILHFWAFGCVNCVRNLPHYRSWDEDFPRDQFTVIGVHTPETQEERQVEGLRQNIKTQKIQYPVVHDGSSDNWKKWGNTMWPSVYLIDKQGRVRNWWYGELNWQGAHGEELFRRRIQELIDEKP